MAKTPFKKPNINIIESLTLQLMKANEDLANANELLLQSEKARTEMLDNISHDLRAPLTTIRVAIERIMQNKNLDNEERNNMILIIDRRFTALEHLVSELYYSVSIEQPNFILNINSIPIVPFLEEWFITRGYSTNNNKRKLVLEISKDFDAFAQIDPDRMVRVLDNLMDNAIKFTKEDDIITLGCHKTCNSIEIYLKDTGCGIIEEELIRIFDRTYIASNSRTPDKKYGSGLGLYIAKLIVQKHGGNLYCQSKINIGSKFIISLPC